MFCIVYQFPFHFCKQITLLLDMMCRYNVFPLGIQEEVQEYHYTQKQCSQHEIFRPHVSDKGDESDESVFPSSVVGGDPNCEVGP
jgi:hypothetical protein